MILYDLDGLKSRNPIVSVASCYVRLSKRGSVFAGPCPVCGGSANNRRFECDPVKDTWVCAVCASGGDVIALVQACEACDFKTAIERLGGAEPVSAEALERLEKQKAERDEKQTKADEAYRQREKQKCEALWSKGRAIEGTATERYLRGRGIHHWQGARLRHIDTLPFFDNGAKLHEGPAMLAMMTRMTEKSGFDCVGLHMTWINPDRPGEKARIIDPATGEVMPAKKVRGTKTGSTIYLGRSGATDEKQSTVFIGEGIETVLSVRQAIGDTVSAYWISSIDLGNLGGAALATVPRGEGIKGRVPGPDPDLSKPAIVMPEWINDIVLLGDGDSERVLTENAMRRAAKRWSLKGRMIRVAWANQGQDFNDMLRFSGPARALDSVENG